MEVSWPIAGSWALAACMVLALLGWWLVKRDRRQASLRAELRTAWKEEKRARKAWQNAVNEGTAEEAVRAAREVAVVRKRIDALRRSLGITLFVALVVPLAGCASKPEVREKIVHLDAHVRIVSPGDTIPDYPEGEDRWWLATPTGLLSLVPAFPRAPGEGEEEDE